MADAGGHVLAKVQALSDNELAILLCLISEQHCIIHTEKQLLAGLEQELRIIVSDVYGLRSAVLECTQHTTLDDFGNGILVQDGADEALVLNHDRSSSGFFAASETTSDSKQWSSMTARPLSSLDSRKIANVVIAKNLNLATSEVQIQALELIRGKRNFTRTAMHAAPKPFVFVALNATDSERLTTHLNDQFYISHKHQNDDGFPNLEELQLNEAVSGDNASTSSIVRPSSHLFEKHKPRAPLFSPHDISSLAKRINDVKISSEARAYLHNIVVFMRLHRAVEGGISAMATRHFTQLAHALAPLHGLDYITPSLIALAARKVYPHRISITAPEHERSMQWGSSLEAVKAVLEGVTAEDVIEEVLQSVEAPL